MTEPRMPVLLRGWLLVTRALPYLIEYLARQMHRRMGAAPERFAERLGTPSQRALGRVIWFHAASLGEVSQIGPVARRLAQSRQATVLVTTTTQAGADWVAREMPDVLHQFVPLDTPAAVAGFLAAWDISLAVFVEGDLWPRTVLETQKRGIPQVLLNARHSRTRERIPLAFAELLRSFALVTCRSEQVAEGIRALDVPDDRIRVLPDLRIATAALPCPADRLEPLARQIGARPVWLAASTHPPDEAAVLDAQRRVLATSPDALLIFAPRHPDRGDVIQAAARAQGFDVARRSADEALTGGTQVYLADTLGEMGVFFTLAPVTFLGGAFGDEGGHNPYEPARFGCAILSGSRVKNFADAFAALCERGAAELLESPAELGLRLAALLGSDQVTTMGDAGRRFMDVSENSVAETVELIDGILQE